MQRRVGARGSLLSADIMIAFEPNPFPQLAGRERAAWGKRCLGVPSFRATQHLKTTAKDSNVTRSCNSSIQSCTIAWQVFRVSGCPIALQRRHEGILFNKTGVSSNKAYMIDPLPPQTYDDYPLAVLSPPKNHLDRSYPRLAWSTGPCPSTATCLFPTCDRPSISLPANIDLVKAYLGSSYDRSR